MMIFYDRVIKGSYSTEKNGNNSIEVLINHNKINVFLSYNTPFNFINREDAIRLELKSHPKLICSEISNSNEICYLSLVTVNIMNIEQQILVRVYTNSSDNLNIVGHDLRNIFGLEMNKNGFTIREVPFLYKKDYLLFEKLLKLNNLTRNDLKLIKDLDEL